MRLTVVADRCQGHARCGQLIPELVDYDEYGFARVKDAGEVPNEQENAVLLAVSSCPEHALVVRRTTTE